MISSLRLSQRRRRQTRITGLYAATSCPSRWTDANKINFLKLTGPDWSYRGEVTFEVKNGEGI